MVDAKRTRGTNVIELQAVADTEDRHGRGVGAVDNLVKGAAGQAIQNANLLLGAARGDGAAHHGGVPVSSGVNGEYTT